ncbi:MAG: HupE/UreJ family protein [Proteobacteria bacterium]|nr:HupE/UreJ family protein [Pseudomonadota bacterium]
MADAVILRLLILGLSLVPYMDTVAHPLGNNTVNRQSAIVVTPGEVTVTYRLELAEIPTLAEGIAADVDRDGQTDNTEWTQWASGRAEAIRRRLGLQINDRTVALQFDKPAWHLAPGEAGLSILSLRLRLTGALNPLRGPVRLRFQDSYNPATAGWQEIWIAGRDGVAILSSTVPTSDRSRALTDFKLPLGAGAPQELSATAELRFDGDTQAASRPLPVADSAAETADESGSDRHAVRSGPASEAWAFFKLGVHHIAVGFDHLAFLLGLLLLSPRLGSMVKVITAFTLAHSTTLALAANGWVAAPGKVIEPMIALTIVYVGVLGVRGWRRDHGLWLAFGFGLLHGFGFAGALSETLASRPESGNWLMNLACFNLGIEALQLLLVSLAFPLLRLCARFAWGLWVERTASLGVTIAGLTWFLLRVSGV